LAAWYERARTDDWHWFGDDMTYANAKMPQAMLRAAEVTGEERFLNIGLETLDFLLAQTFRSDQFDFPGNRGWLKRKGPRANFGQQPIEAGYMAESLMTAAEITHDSKYLKLANAAVEWLLGRNRLGTPLYDLANGSCADGLDPRGVSMNQGAESVICCLLGLLSVSSQSERRLESATSFGAEEAAAAATAAAGAD